MTETPHKVFGRGTGEMTIDEMIARKKELGYSYEQIADLSGLPVGTVQKVLGKITKAPRRSTVLALEKALQKRQVTYRVHPEDDLSMVAEAAPKYGTAAEKPKKDGEYTLEDFYALPEDQRVELIDGVFYDMSTPSIPHQLIAFRLGALIDECIRTHECPCKVLSVPIDVQLDRDNKTMVEPDVTIFCGNENVRRWGYYGAPDFVAEILSPSTRRKDMLLKLNKYSRAGVREYWIIDPKNLTVFVYDLENDLNLQQYEFTDKIPIMISEGKCMIDFNVVYEEVKPYLELEE